MNAIHCPSCRVALTNAEAERGRCPACGKTLPSSVVDEAGARLHYSVTGSPASSQARRKRDPDHLPQLARVAKWMMRIGGAGMLFLFASCCAVSMLLGVLVPNDVDDATRHSIIGVVGTVLGVLIAVCFITLLIGSGLALIAGDGD